MAESVQKEAPFNIDSAEIVYHMLAKTDILQKYLASSKGHFDFFAFVDFASDYVKNEANPFANLDAVGAYDETFEVVVVEYQGIYFVQANEFDDIGFFLSRSEAEEAAKDLASHYQ